MKGVVAADFEGVAAVVGTGPAAGAGAAMGAAAGATAVAAGREIPVGRVAEYGQATAPAEVAVAVLGVDFGWQGPEIGRASCRERVCCKV